MYQWTLVVTESGTIKWNIRPYYIPLVPCSDVPYCTDITASLEKGGLLYLFARLTRGLVFLEFRIAEKQLI